MQPGELKKLVPIPEDRITVVCLHCNQPQEVGRRTLSLTCRHCRKPLRLEDLQFKDFQSRRVVETGGVVTIEKKANVTTDKIVCGGLIVRGKVKGHITSRGPVLVGPDAEIKGDVTAPTLAVGAGAVLEGNYAIGTLNRAESQASPDPAATATTS